LNRYPVAKILKAFGLRGELKIKIYFSPPSYFKNYNSVFVNDKELGFIEFKVEKFKILFDNFALIKFEKLDSRNDVEKLRGYEIFVYENMLPPKNNGEYYVFELEGLNVYYEKKKIGFIKDIITKNEYTIFKIKTENDEIFIPFNKHFIEKIDLENRACILRRIDETIINS
jgi:16S rRNA processing protein RimM